MKPRIAICTSDDRYSKKEGYWTLTDKANKKYCKRQKYDYKCYDLTNEWFHSPEDKKIHMDRKHSIQWIKLQVVKDLAVLKKYDIIVWVDSDVIIHNHEKRIEDFIGPANENVICDFISDGEFSSSPCSGIFFLWAKHPKAVDFLNSWNTYEYTGFDLVERLYQYFLHHHSKQFEQRIVKCKLWPYQDFLRVVKAPSFNITDSKQFFYHCANYNQDRNQRIKDVYEKVISSNK